MLYSVNLLLVDLDGHWEDPRWILVVETTSLERYVLGLLVILVVNAGKHD